MVIKVIPSYSQVSIKQASSTVKQASMFHRDLRVVETGLTVKEFMKILFFIKPCCDQQPN